MQQTKTKTAIIITLLLASIILLNLPFVHAAATRFYFPSSGNAAVSPAYSADWEKTSQAGTRFRCVTAKTISSMASITMTETSSAANYDMLARQYVSDPIAAQTISGTVNAQFRASEANAAADADVALKIYVVNSTGNGVRGTLLSYFPNALTNEFAVTTLTNRMFPASTALINVTTQDGDRLVFEVGTRMFNTITTSYNILISFGDNAIDLVVDNSTTTANAPWIEFSNGIVFYNTNDYNGGWNAGNTTGYNTGYTDGNATGWISGNASGWLAGNTTGYTNGFNAGNATGFTLGNTTGYNLGWTTGNSTGYTNGYSAGYATGLIDGNATGYTAGWNNGNATGYSTGYSNGYNAGLIAGNATGWISGNSTGYNTGWNAGNTTGYTTGYTIGYTAGLLAGGGSGSGGGGGGGGQLPPDQTLITINVLDWLNKPVTNANITILNFYDNKTVGSNFTDTNGTTIIKAPYTTLLIKAKIGSLNTEQTIAHNEKLYTQNVTIQFSAQDTITNWLNTPILRIPLYILIIAVIIVLALIYVLFIQKVKD